MTYPPPNPHTTTLYLHTKHNHTLLSTWNISTKTIINEKYIHEKNTYIRMSPIDCFLFSNKFLHIDRDSNINEFIKSKSTQSFIHEQNIIDFIFKFFTDTKFYEVTLKKKN